MEWVMHAYEERENPAQQTMEVHGNAVERTGLARMKAIVSLRLPSTLCSVKCAV